MWREKPVLGLIKEISSCSSSAEGHSKDRLALALYKSILLACTMAQVIPQAQTIDRDALVTRFGELVAEEGHDSLKPSLISRGVGWLERAWSAHAPP